MKILVLTAHFSPNVGGVETHLDDLVDALTRRGIVVTVLTYQPLVTNALWKLHEKSRNFEVFRIPWFAGLFYKLIKSPILEFLYLTPALFVVAPFIILIKQPNTIHTHGLIAGFVGVFWGKVFGSRVITTTHSIYHFPKSGLYRDLVKWIFANSFAVLTLSKQSAREIINLGINENKVKVFTYWVDLGIFKPEPSKLKAKRKLGWTGKFVVLFVGRLIEEKGVGVLMDSIRLWNKKINLVVIGVGPMSQKIKDVSRRQKNLMYVGKVENKKLPAYYNASDILIVPSVHEEGFGRVIIEALACGLPVIGARRGAIPEAMNNSVGKLIDISSEKIEKTVDDFYQNSPRLKKFASNAAKFARVRYGDANVETIIQSYK